MEAFNPQKKTSSNIKILNFFLFLWVICHPGFGFAEADVIESGSNRNPDLTRIRIRNTYLQNVA
jgi:hypothetical protein